MLHFLGSEKIEKMVFLCFGKVEDARNPVECGTLKDRPNSRYGVSGIYGRIRTAHKTSRTNTNSNSKGNQKQKMNRNNARTVRKITKVPTFALPKIWEGRTWGTLA